MYSTVLYSPTYLPELSAHKDGSKNVLLIDGRGLVMELVEAIDPWNRGRATAGFMLTCVSHAVTSSTSAGLPDGHMEGAFMRRVSTVSRFAVLAATWETQQKRTKSSGHQAAESAPASASAQQGNSKEPPSPPPPSPSHFQMFACDWVVDPGGQGHLLECNSTPETNMQHLSTSTKGQ